jgi:hypothetical protein
LLLSLLFCGRSGQARRLEGARAKRARRSEGQYTNLLRAQAAFLAHDAAHHGIIEPPKKGCINWLAWMLGSVVFGISTNMWNEEHSMHHAITIRPREDPQFDYLPLWLISEKEMHVTKRDGPDGYERASAREGGGRGGKTEGGRANEPSEERRASVALLLLEQRKALLLLARARRRPR